MKPYAVFLSSNSYGSWWKRGPMLFCFDSSMVISVTSVESLYLNHPIFERCRVIRAGNYQAGSTNHQILTWFQELINLVSRNSYLNSSSSTTTTNSNSNKNANIFLQETHDLFQWLKFTMNSKFKKNYCMVYWKFTFTCKCLMVLV